MKKTFNMTSPSLELNNLMILYGFENVKKRKNADLIILNSDIGDIDPHYYNHSRHPLTTPKPTAFLREREIFSRWVGKKAIIGVGKASHLVHIMNGGVIFQNSYNHEFNHETIVKDKDKETTSLVKTESSHSQIMGNEGIGTLIAYTPNLAENKEYFIDNKSIINVNPSKDIEAMYYKTNTMSWQPNPTLGIKRSKFECGSKKFITSLTQYLEY